MKKVISLKNRISACLVGLLLGLPAWFLRDMPDTSKRTYRYEGSYVITRAFPNRTYVVLLSNQTQVLVFSKTPLKPKGTGVILNDGFKAELHPH
jgi:hypothetical protein